VSRVARDLKLIAQVPNRPVLSAWVQRNFTMKIII